jgi:hypothetical protein
VEEGYQATTEYMEKRSFLFDEVIILQENEMGWACCAYEGEERCAQVFVGEA